MTIPRLRNKNIICGTNVGIVVLTIEDDNEVSYNLCNQILIKIPMYIEI